MDPEKKIKGSPYRMPHVHDLEGICWCEPTLIVINNEYDMIQEFGKIIPEMQIPCALWKHKAEN